MSNAAVSSPPAGPAADEQGVAFLLADRYRRLSAVRLAQDLCPDRMSFTRDRTQWSLRIPRPPVDRMEYLFEIEDHNGHRTTITDPGNERRAPGAFGDKSVLEFAEYAAPGWVEATGIDGGEVPLSVPAPRLDGAIAGSVWSPLVLDGAPPAPLLVVHDGPEFAALGAFVHYVATSITAGLLPPLRIALLDPGERNEWYAANPDYSDTLALDVLAHLPPATVRIGVGVSLGALALLHAHRAHPGTFDGLLLQSGSFFTPDLDGQESGFSGFAAVTRFVEQVHAGARDDHPVPVALTCGVAEENLANNRRIARTLDRLGYPTSVQTLRDAHNYTAWRDALHPSLTDLITTVVARHAA